MTTERLSAAAVLEERDALDATERLVFGDQVVNISFTNGVVKTLSPAEMESVAAHLFALIDREPTKSAPGYAPHRMVLGVLAKELRSFASSAGEPTGLEVDLRAATSQADERRIRQRIADQEAAYARHVDDVLLQQEALRSLQEDRTGSGSLEDQAAAAPATEPDDDTRYL